MDGFSSMETTQVNERVTINCGGLRHETYSNTIKNIPDTRLYWVIENKNQLPEFDPNANEFFFDRHPGVFAQILNFYRTGKLHCPNDVCGPLFEEELAFWGIDEFQVEPCCWLNYKKHMEAQANLHAFDGTESDGDETVSDMDMTVYGLVADSIRNRNKSFWKKYQPKIWNTLEEPYSSRLAQVIAFTTLLLILTSVTTFCLETLQYFSDEKSAQAKGLYIAEAICVAWFTAEFIMRLAFCPSKISFFKKPMNWIDLGAVLPFYLEMFLNGSDIKTIVVLRVVRLIRVFRIFKLSRHSYGLQILGHTLKSSFSELFLLVFFLSIGVVIFSSVIYYAEKDVTDTKFKTIPHSFWWAVVTMTTLGYGDMVPSTPSGQVVGSLCALCGVLMIALPIPVIVSNFSLYYSHAKAKLNLPKKKRQVIIGAANALRSAEPFGGSQANGNAGVESPGSNSDSPSPRASFRCSPVPSFRPSLRAALPVASPASCRASPVTQSPRDCRRAALFAPETREVEFEMKEARSLHRQASPDLREISDASNTHVTPETSEGHAIFIPLPVLNQPSVPPISPSSKSSDHDSVSGGARALRSDGQRSRSASKSVSIDSSQGSPNSQSRGRRGRRGSLYVVGFTAKHWQNKALKGRERSCSTPRNATELLPCPSSVDQETRSLAPGWQQNESVEQSTGHESSGNCGMSAKGKEAVKDLSRNTSTGTQTEKKGKKNLSSSSSSKRDKAEAYSHAKSIQTSLSVESNDSSGKMSDDSLFVHEILRQRRGSSPLIRQKAVFTFDSSDHARQVDQRAGNLDTSRIKHTGRVSGDSSLHPAPLIAINGGEAKGRNTPLMGRSRARSNSCIPAISVQRKPTDHGQSGAKGSKSRSKPSVAGCVNGSFRQDEGVVPSHTEPGNRMSAVRSDPATDDISVKENLVESGRPRSDSYPRYPHAYHDSADAHVSGDVAPASCSSENNSQRAYLSPESTLPSITEEIDAKSESDARRSSAYSREDGHQLPASHELPRVLSFPAIGQVLARPVVSRRPYSDSACTDRRGSISPELYNPKFYIPAIGGNSPRRTPDSSRTSPPRDLEGTHRRSYDDPRNSASGSPSSELAQRHKGKILYVQLPLPDAGTEMAGNVHELDRRKSGPGGGAVVRDMATSPFVFQTPRFFSGHNAPSVNSGEPEGVFFANQSNTGTSRRSSRDTSLPRKVSGTSNMSGTSSNMSGRPNPLLNSSRSQDSNTCTPLKSTTGSNQEAMDYNPRTYQHFQETSSHEIRRSTGIDVSSAVDRRTPPNVGETSVYDRQDDEALGRPRSPLVETDRQVVLNGYMSGASARRPSSASSDPRQRARAMFFGDSGISSVGSAGNNSISHSVESDVDPDERKGSVSSVSRVEILNPIHENDGENPSTVSVQQSRQTSRKSGPGSGEASVVYEASVV